MVTNLDYINQTCTDLGGVAGHVTNLSGLNEICTLLGGTGGHFQNINAYNEICTLQSVATSHVLNLNALNAIVNGSYVTNNGALAHLGASLNLNSIKSLMAFWSDGTVSGSQLTDLSGNSRHGFISDNILTDANCEAGTVLTEFATACTLNENTTADFHTGTRCLHLVCGADSRGGYTPNRFRTALNEVVNYSFWVKRISGTIKLYIAGGTTGFMVNQSITPTLNTWVQVTGSYTETSPGHKAYMAFVQAGATNCEFYIDDISISVQGKAGIGITMANDSALKAIDGNNHFFTAAGIPLTYRTDIEGRGFYNRKIFVKDAKSYVWMAALPSVDNKNLIDTIFTNFDFIFDSCENVKTVGAGKDYATIQAAITAAGNALVFNNRYRFDVYDDFSSVAQGPYITTQLYNYINGVGTAKTVHLEIPASSSDAQHGLSDTMIAFANMGSRNMIFENKNGKYACHIDAVGNANCFQTFYKTKFSNLGSQDIIDYRIANSQAYTGVLYGKIAIGMGASTNQTSTFNLCEATGIVPIFFHSNANVVTVLDITEFRKCTVTSLALFNTNVNPLSEIKENVSLQRSTANVDSEFRFVKNTINSDLSLEGTRTPLTAQILDYGDILLTVK